MSGHAEGRGKRALQDDGASASSPGVDGCGAQPHGDADTAGAGLPPELAREVRQTLADLGSVELARPAWPAVAADLARLDAAVTGGDPCAVRAALVPVAQAAFEGRVRGRLAGAGTRSAAVVPTKPTPMLPVVGAMCAAVMLVIGYLIGGPVILAATAVLAAGVLVVAVAGTRVAADRARASQQRRLAPSAEQTEPPPVAVRSAIRSVASHLDAAA